VAYKVGPEDIFTVKRLSRRGAVYASALFPLLLGVGVMLRGAGEVPVVFTALIYRPGLRVEYPGTRTAESAAKTFYLAVDNGDYGKAYGIILEPDWSGGEGPAPFREAVEARSGPIPCWTPEEEFLRRMEDELGTGGTGITLQSVEARVLEERDPLEYGDIPGVHDIRNCYRVEASGNILGACSIFTWKKELVVLQFGKGYRLLLSGTKNENGYYYQTWFSDFERVGTIRGQSGSEGEGSGLE
jgi:hypothetical protein